jgi:hypothetical protein
MHAKFQKKKSLLVDFLLFLHVTMPPTEIQGDLNMVFKHDAIVLTIQRGVTGTARHTENIICCGVTSAAHHSMCSHSFVYISTT